MNTASLARIAAAALALAASAPAFAQTQGSTVLPGPKDLFADPDGARNVTCMMRETRGGIEHLYRAEFAVVGDRIASGNDDTFASATAFMQPGRIAHAPGVRVTAVHGKIGLREDAAFHQDWGSKVTTSYNLTLALDLPDVSGPDPLISRVFLDGEQIWYQGLHQPKPGTAHFEINRRDVLGERDLPLHGVLRFVFERADAQVAEFSFNTASLEAREYLDAKTKPIVDRFVDRMSPPAGCR